MQLSFDGDRHLTPWLSIIGKRAANPPYVEVELTRSGNTITSGAARGCAHGKLQGGQRTSACHWHPQLLSANCAALRTAALLGEPPEVPPQPLQRCTDCPAAPCRALLCRAVTAEVFELDPQDQKEHAQLVKVPHRGMWHAAWPGTAGSSMLRCPACCPT